LGKKCRRYSFFSFVSVDFCEELSNVTLLSIGGGIRDFQVSSSLIWFDSIPDDNIMTAISTSIPQVQVSTDHQCIVWCNQMVKALTSTLFSILDESKYEILSKEERMEQFRKQYQRYLRSISIEDSMSKSIS
jgi:hypothetical protein